MKIIIDADGCPVVDITLRVAEKYGTECVIVCDTSHIFSTDNAKVVTVDKGADSADFKVVNMAGEGDIVVTQDYGLAAMCLARKAVPINQDGMIYTADNIEPLLQSRYKAKKIRNAGGRLKGPKKRTTAQDKAFEECIEGMMK